MNEGLVGGLQIITSGVHVVIDQTKERTNDLGFFAQEEALIKDRLNVTVGVRGDQSSNNSDASKLFYYPKGALSYRFGAVKRGLIDELKLRAAVGESGNEPNYRLKFSELNSVNIASVPAHTIASTVASSDVHPERQREIEAGIDATLLGSRANLEFTVYDKHISDLLLTRSLAPVTGFSTQVFNGGVMQTRGMEIGLNVMPIQSRAIQWSSNFNFFMSRSKILSLPVPTFRQSANARYGSLQIEVGKSPTQVIAWVPADPNNPTVGRKDAVIGDYNPDYKLSWASDLTVKKLRFYWLFDRYQGGWIHNYTELLYDFAGNTRDYTDPVPAGSPLAPYGTQMGPARIKAGTTNCSACAWMQPMTYTKLREASVSYELPASFTRNLWSGARYVRATLSGRNLLIFTKYRGGDPEVLVRSATLYTQWRSDIWPYIPYRSFWFSLDVGF
jgi:outer membrane receptor protein involved in Fe transport